MTLMDHPENSAEYKGLTVNAGVENLPSVNPYATFRRKKTVLSPEEYFEGIRRGDMTILSQAVTLVESNLLADQAVAQKVIELCLPYAGNSIRVGITGVPGAGKSTFIEALGSELCDQGKHLAVLPDDPEVYTHRSGRTGRAGKRGISVSIVHIREVRRINELERLLKRTFKRSRLPLYAGA